MKLRLKRYYENLVTSYWFVPGIMAIVSLFLVPFVLSLQSYKLIPDNPLFRSLVAIGPNGARSILSTIASSSIGTASVVFSVSIVALSLTASQFGPRLLKNFLAQNTAQFAYGTFIGTFLYSLLSLSVIPNTTADVRVPYLIVVVAIVLGALSFGVLIYFIQYTVTFMQASNVIHNTSSSLHKIFGELPDINKGEHVAINIKKPKYTHHFNFLANRTGYVQAIDYQRLIEIADEHDCLMEIHIAPGDFLIYQQMVITIHSEQQGLDSEIRNNILEQIIVGRSKTATQDMQFAVEQIVEVAVRALSPGVNDPITAINCIDQLSAALSLVAQKELPGSTKLNSQGLLRLIVPKISYDDLIRHCFNQIRQHGATDSAVIIRLMETFECLLCIELPDEMRTSLKQHAKLVYDNCSQLTHDSDSQRVRNLYEAIQARHKPVQKPDMAH